MKPLKTTLAVGALTAAAALAAAPTASAQTAPCGPRAKACVDLSENASWLMEGGAVTYGPVPITTGKPGYETPPGEFAVSWKNIDHWSRAYNGPMPFAVFFTEDGIAFHQGSLDSQSHGCVRLAPEAAETYFYALEPGDLVQVVP